MADPKPYQSDFVRRERERKPHYVTLYSPHAGQKFRFKRHNPGQWFERDRVTGAIRRIPTPPNMLYGLLDGIRGRVTGR